MKGISLITRREGTTRETFRDYYEKQHAPLGMRYFPFCKYLRNHVIDASKDINFDVIMESYFPAGTDIATINSGEIRAIMDVDERKFMKPEMIRSTSANEHIIKGAENSIAQAGTRRLMLLLNSNSSAQLSRANLDQWGAALMGLQGVERISLDIAMQQISTYATFPYAAILSLWLGTEAEAVQLPAAPEGVKLEVSVLTEVHETRPEVLAERYQG
ncbi:EthD domain-containing protein [Parahaliea sp. F7430]|uniref:EthD domain-containing protein n=1 Tax=Sediminihaliea albiluteola TaxID=2758564 RepID=A0A7W2YJK3_9GAMM|nr:EthD domain-containing protein [Sediminihaliea albiluteola]MBA6413167.1 EthD domain-containing protein [Sediminihaliea albiluteola]